MFDTAQLQWVLDDAAVIADKFAESPVTKQVAIGMWVAFSLIGTFFTGRGTLRVFMAKYAAWRIARKKSAEAARREFMKELIYDMKEFQEDQEVVNLAKKRSMERFGYIDHSSPSASTPIASVATPKIDPAIFAEEAKQKDQEVLGRLLEGNSSRHLHK